MQPFLGADPRHVALFPDPPPPASACRQVQGGGGGFLFIHSRAGGPGPSGSQLPSPPQKAFRFAKAQSKPQARRDRARKEFGLARSWRQVPQFALYPGS